MPVSFNQYFVPIQKGRIALRCPLPKQLLDYNNRNEGNEVQIYCLSLVLGFKGRVKVYLLVLDRIPDLIIQILRPIKQSRDRLLPMRIARFFVSGEYTMLMRIEVSYLSTA